MLFDRGVAAKRLLAKESDDVVAGKIGQSVNAVRVTRTWRGILTARNRRPKAGGVGVGGDSP
jgi:hypothetical protein